MTDMLDNRTALAPTLAHPGDAPIALLGSGLLHTALATSLVERCLLVAIDDLAEETSVPAAALVVASDADDTRGYPALLALISSLTVFGTLGMIGFRRRAVD